VVLEALSQQQPPVVVVDLKQMLAALRAARRRGQRVRLRAALAQLHQESRQSTNTVARAARVRPPLEQVSTVLMLSDSQRLAVVLAAGLMRALRSAAAMVQPT